MLSGSSKLTGSNDEAQPPKSWGPRQGPPKTGGREPQPLTPRRARTDLPVSLAQSQPAKQELVVSLSFDLQAPTGLSWPHM